MSTQPLTIVSLEAENVKRIRAVRIQPDGAGLVVIKGENGQGKSSVLDSIAYALGGEKLCPPKVIRDGEQNATATLDLGEMVVSRRWTPGGSRLEVRTHEGAKYPSPQGILDKLVGTLSFDPLAFSRQKPAEQRETLRRLVGLDFSGDDAKRKALYDERTVVNRRVAEHAAAVSGATHYPDAPERELVLAELLAEQDRLVDAGRQRDARLADVQLLERRASEASRLVETTQGEITRLEEMLAHLRTTLAERQAAEGAARAKATEARAAAEALSVPDLAPVRARIAGAEETNRKVRANAARDAAQAKHVAAVAEAKRLTDAIEALDTAKAKALADAKFPIAGLSLTDTGVTFNGVPLEQASQAEQIRVSLAIGLALNPRLRVMLIRDGSLLDAKSMQLVAEMAAKAGAQVWVERVGTEGTGGVVIEDGEVRGAAAEPIADRAPVAVEPAGIATGRAAESAVSAAAEPAPEPTTPEEFARVLLDRIAAATTPESIKDVELAIVARIEAGAFPKADRKAQAELARVRKAYLAKRDDIRAQSAA